MKNLETLTNFSANYLICTSNVCLQLDHRSFWRHRN